MQGYTLRYTNRMEGFTVSKFNHRTAELIGRPELSKSFRMKMMAAKGQVCGLKELKMIEDCGDVCGVY